MKDYYIHREGIEEHCGAVIVKVQYDCPPSGHRKVEYDLPFHPSLAVCPHSPTGFEFGYAGSGPAQLALAILMDFTGKIPDSAMYQAFKFMFIMPMKHPGGVIKGDTIQQWIDQWDAEQKGVYNQ